MGGQTFSTTVKGATAREAYNLAVAEAQYEKGHGGYTGTIAEKNGFRMFSVPSSMSSWEFVKRVQDHDLEDLDKADHKEIGRAIEVFDDKWGPAVCIEVEKGSFLFFGWASS